MFQTDVIGEGCHLVCCRSVLRNDVEAMPTSFGPTTLVTYLDGPCDCKVVITNQQIIQHITAKSYKHTEERLTDVSQVDTLVDATHTT